MMQSGVEDDGTPTVKIGTATAVGMIEDVMTGGTPVETITEGEKEGRLALEPNVIYYTAEFHKDAS